MDHDLRSYFLDNITEPLRQMMTEIEQTICRPIEFVPSPAISWTSSTRARSVWIGIPSSGEFSQHSAYHELLHIRRYALERVPLLVATEDKIPQWRDLAQQIQNDTEHALMAPIERSCGFDPNTFWTKALFKRLIAVESESDPRAIRFDLTLLLQYRECLAPHLVDALISIANRSRNSDIVDRAERIRIRLAINKPDAMRRLIRCMGLDVSAFQLLYIDARNFDETLVELKDG